jgi:ribosome biogenesis GTPase
MTDDIGESVLAAYGWTVDTGSVFESCARPGLKPARILSVNGADCDAVGEDGHFRIVPRRTGDRPCSGDWVAYEPTADPAVIAEILPRSSTVRRRRAGEGSDEQIIAVNVDEILIVFPVLKVNHNQLERYLAVAWDSGAIPSVVISKIDLGDDLAGVLERVSREAPGVPVHLVDSISGRGVEEIRGSIRGTVALIGPSGAGKSTLGNALLGADRLAVGTVRESDGKGRHTTTKRELVPIPSGGVLIDTPGLRSVGMWHADEGLQAAFAEIEELSGSCRFRDCEHQQEPGCAVLEAVARGEISRRRHGNYLRLLRENEWVSSRDDREVRERREKREKDISKHSRHTAKIKGRSGR